MGVDNRKERYGAFLDDVDQPNLKALHGFGTVNEAQLETSGTFRVIPNKALPSLSAASTVILLRIWGFDFHSTFCELQSIMRIDWAKQL